ncbi:MAG: S-adenosylmethionine decarboxylase [Nanoarchaeota archaeon]|nr:S-adenosylmethionine decarboxylase [Nanoarchaeota archaeon]MBU1976826.1 S-adenosylmethionine decarboxylase [Nanoarchaeota archaeon]
MPQKKDWWWGRSASIDLHGCNHNLIKNPKEIKKFVCAIVKELKMKRVGPPKIKRFGHGKLRGYSMMQFIETSTIISHFDEQGDRAFIDVFSCKTYNPKKTAKFCKDFFKADKYTLYVEERK